MQGEYHHFDLSKNTCFFIRHRWIKTIPYIVSVTNGYNMYGFQVESRALASSFQDIAKICEAKFG